MSGPRGGRPADRHFQRQADDPPGTSRLFIAVPVADRVKENIGRLMEQVAGAPIEERAFGQPRWVRVDGLHLTLRFLGATPNERIGELKVALESAAVGLGPFEIELHGGGAFPSPYRPRVLWIGISRGGDELAELVRQLDVELSPLGWTPESRPFSPHLTLARTDGVSGSSDKASRLIELARDVAWSWKAEELILYRSLLGRGPARYEAVETAPLRAR